MSTLSLTRTYVAITAVGSVKVTITPAAAIAAGAQWQVDDGGWINSGVTVFNVTVGFHIIKYRTATGYLTPANETTQIFTNQTKLIEVVYAIDPSAITLPRPAKKLSNLPYPFWFKSLEEIRDYLIKFRAKLAEIDFSITVNDIGTGLPPPSLGAIIYGDAEPKWVTLLGQTTTTKKVLTQTGTGTLSAAPRWETYAGIPMDGVLYEMLKCDEEVLSWGWREGTGNTFLGLDVIAGGDTTGGYDTYLGYQAGYYSSTATANVVAGAGAGTFLRTTYTIDPDIDYQFTLRRTGSAQADSPYTLFKFGDYLISREDQPGDGVHETRTAFLKSTDGVNWTEWFYINVYDHYRAYSCVEFSGKLYINWYNAYSNPRLQIWDGNTVTTALTSVAQGNYLAGPMIVSGSKLWILTDVTPTTPGRRVAYWTADGITYNSVTNYDGASYLYYGRSTYLPAVGSSVVGRFMANRWLEFKDVLYLFASVWNTTNSSWSWQVWQAGTTAFTKVYDSSEFNDGYCISSVVTNGDFIIATGNTTLGGSGAYLDDCRVYRSTNATSWSVVATLPDQGLCYESIEYGNIFYSMFVMVESADDPDYYVKICYWDDENSAYVQCNNSITTETNYVSGNLIEYKGSFFVGKWKELYELTRTKSTTITVAEKEASGNTIAGAAAGDMPISGNLNCLYGYNSNLSSPEVENSTAIGAYARVSRDNTIVLGATGDDYQVDVAIGQTYAIGRLHVHQYGEKEIDAYGAYIDNISTNTGYDGINKYGLYVVSTGTFTGSTGTGTKNYGIYLPAVTGADTNYGFYSVSNITTENQLISSIADGTAPLVVTSTTEVANLNAHLLQGNHASAFLTSVTAHNILSATHGDTTVGSATRGDIITGQGASPNTKWVRLAVGAAGTYLAGSSTEPSWATLNQAAIVDLKTTDGPSFEHLHLTIADGTAPMVVTSSTEVANLNVHLLQGNHASAFEPALGNPGTSGFVLSSTDVGVRSWIAGGGVASFVDLDDVPANYSGAGGYVVKVNAGANALEFVAGGAGVSSFNDLDDVPASYEDQGGLFARVKATEDGLEYAAGGAGAPTNAKYIVQEANGDLSAEQSLGALATGILKNTTTASVGVLSIAVGADLPAHNVLSATHGDTLADSVLRGDVMIGNLTPKWSRLALGAANQVLGGDATDTKWVTACPAAAKYIVGLAHSDLSAEKVKTQLYLNYDIDDTPGSPNAMDDEFDDSSINVKWTKVNDPAGANAMSETAYVGYLWVGLPELVTDDFDHLVRIYQAPPSGSVAWTFVIKASVGVEALASSTDAGEFTGVGVYVGTLADDQLQASIMQYNDASGDYLACRLQGQDDMGLMTFNNYQIVPAGGSYYLKLEKITANAYTSANTYNTYYSFNGITWYHTGSHSKTFTHACDELGICFRAPKAQGGTPIGYGIVDFFRRTV